MAKVGNEDRANCWEFHRCGREPAGTRVADLGVCVSATETAVDGIHGGRNGGRTCWAIVGTLCGGVSRGTYSSKLATCMECSFYAHVHRAVGDSFVSPGKVAQILDRSRKAPESSQPLGRAASTPARLPLVGSMGCAAPASTPRRECEARSPSRAPSPSAAGAPKPAVERAPVFGGLRSGEVFHGRYEVVRALGRGGMGEVYEVIDERTLCPLALKIMHPSLSHDPEFRARFEREARIPGAIESEHITKVCDAAVDVETGVPFIVMELLRGADLHTELTRRGPLPVPEVVEILTQTCLGLTKTHAAGIAHRDLKPENLFLTYRDGGGLSVKILDFGVAKMFRDDPLLTARLGTPMFMAPEQIRGGGATDSRVDIYALGHIAYAILTGEPYWAEEESKSRGSIYELYTSILGGAPESPSARAERRCGVSLPPEFDAWFFRATAVARDGRFDGATAAAGALAEALLRTAPQGQLANEAPAKTAPIVTATVPTGPTGEGAIDAAAEDSVA